MKKNCIVTGACGAIGKAIAWGLAEQGYHVYITSRSQEKAKQTAEELKTLSQNHHIYPVCIDLGIQKEIIDFATKWKEPLQLLVNNAAIAPKKRTETVDCIEMQWAVNVLGYYHMIRLFSPYMQELPRARIVNVASYYAGELDLEDPEFLKRPYDNDTAYRQSKQADRMLTKTWADKLRPFGITVNCCHPGDVKSQISKSMGFGGNESPEQAAKTPLWLATSKDLDEVTGAYADHCAIIEDPFTRDNSELERLKFTLRSYIIE